MLKNHVYLTEVEKFRFKKYMLEFPTTVARTGDSFGGSSVCHNPGTFSGVNAVKMVFSPRHCYFSEECAH